MIYRRSRYTSVVHWRICRLPIRPCVLDFRTRNCTDVVTEFQEAKWARPQYMVTLKILCFERLQDTRGRFSSRFKQHGSAAKGSRPPLQDAGSAKAWHHILQRCVWNSLAADPYCIRSCTQSQKAQLPFRKMGTTRPSRVWASMFMESQPIMKSSWIMESLMP